MKLVVLWTMADLISQRIVQVHISLCLEVKQRPKNRPPEGDSIQNFSD